MPPLNKPQPPIRAMIVDDERLGRAGIRSLLDDFPRWSVVAEADDGESAVSIAAAEAPAVVFLDIEMPGLNGIDVARRLGAGKNRPFIVFVTAYSRFATSAFDVDAVHYLLKPVSQARFAEALARAELAIDRAARPTDRPGEPHGSSFVRKIIVRSVGRVRVVPVNRLIWVEAAGNYVTLHTDDAEVVHRQPISSLERQLDPARFLRVHRSAIVRRSAIAELKTSASGRCRLALENGASVAVSEKRRAAVMDALRAN
ncbi:MAG: LytTR family DNA-binding domain-containing protein [Pseudomonadota bacterium]